MTCPGRDANRGAWSPAAWARTPEVESAIVRSRDFLLSKQHPEGYWCGELEADSMLEADYIYLHTLLGAANPRA
jgi:squalene cyclase